MILKNNLILFIGLLIGCTFLGCTEVIEIKTTDFQNILVINANITSDTKQQQVLLSRTYEAGSTKINETNASVIISDNTNTIYQFSEIEDGLYVSNFSFAIQADKTYQLSVTTSDGEIYKSAIVKPISSANLENVKTVVNTDDNGIEGVEIKVDSYDATGMANYFRYEYEETYLIESFYEIFEDLIVVGYDSLPQFARVPKTKEEKICYKTEYSNDILITSTDNATESRVTDFQIRFIPKTDFSIRNRYSILVYQYVQSREANAFYKSLKEFSSSESLFSQTQPGFIVGNIKPENINNKVIGFFEVSMVDSKRIFFNFKDVFPDDFRPRFISNCFSQTFNKSEYFELVKYIESGKYKYVSYDYVTSVYTIVNDFCVDCTLLGTNVKPSFWED
mgnify:CR=1 FL=1|tara:strand:- start:70399 stop:71574 length:1176 start_codon:yes stop_codon:yes gene_type:complete